MNARPCAVLTALAFSMLAGCKRGEPPTWVDDSGAQAALAPIETASADASVDAAPGEVVDAGDPGLLPQTTDQPDSNDSTFLARMQLLWSAILLDDPDKALPTFFPESAYEQTKAIEHPEADWRRRLVAHFKRDIHALHVEVMSSGVGMSARLLRIELPDKHARWIEPGEEGNKLGYWRVYGTRIVWTAEDEEHDFPITSLISWRGQWYVVHLTGFK
ncbi:MAG: hypothetical protein ACRELY_31720 [Polyangiaceae bacterium]